MQQLAGARVAADEIYARADHIAAGGGDYRVRFGVHAAAQLIALARRDAQRLACAAAKVAAIAAAARRAVVAGGDYLVVADRQVERSRTESAISR